MIDWSKAPEDATHCIEGHFRKWENDEEFIFYVDRWESERGDSWSLDKYLESTLFNDIEERPSLTTNKTQETTQHFNKLTEAETERLSILAEECGEVIQAVGKILRHGYDSCHPETGETNRQALERELGDLEFITGFIEEHCDVNSMNVLNYSRHKEGKIDRFLHHNQSNPYEDGIDEPEE